MKTCLRVWLAVEHWKRRISSTANKLLLQGLQLTITQVLANCSYLHSTTVVFAQLRKRDALVRSSK